MAMTVYKTQKVKGIRHLSTLPFLGQKQLLDKPGRMYHPDSFHLGEKDTIFVFPQTHIPSFPTFARPCPLEPRHGFVESRIVTDQYTLSRLVMETYKADPDAEIIFMNRFTGKFSFVACPNLLVIGKGNDGATSGKGKLIQIATPTPAGSNWNTVFLGHNTPTGGQVAYLEGVEHEGRVRLVQSRLGPAQAGSMTDYIPKEMVVQAVVMQNEDDLLKWEKMVKEWAKVPGLVVWAPGSSLSSHFAVHCIQSGVAYVTGEKVPNVGDTLKLQAPPKLTKLGRGRVAEDLRRRLQTGYMTMDKSPVREAGLALAVAHAQSIWGNDELSSRLRARGFLNLIRYAGIACIGENRHFARSGPGRPAQPDDEPKESGKYVEKEFKREPKMPWELLKLSSAPWETVRETCYTHLHKVPMEELMEMVRLSADDLRMPGWVQGMGGDKWAQAADQTIQTWERLKHFIGAPTKETWTVLCLAINKLANSVHNNGNLFNKFLGGFMNYVPNYPVLGFAGASPIIIEEVTGDEVKMDKLWAPGEEQDEEEENPFDEPEEEVEPLDPDGPAVEIPVPAPDSPFLSGKSASLVSSEYEKFVDGLVGHSHVIQTNHLGPPPPATKMEEGDIL